MNSAYLVHNIDIMNTATNGLESLLSSPDFVLGDEQDEALWAKLASAPSKLVFSNARFLTETTKDLRAAVQRIAGVGPETLLSKPGVHRARLLLTSFTAIVCLWRPLKNGGRRIDVMTKCKALLSNVSMYGSCEPFVAIQNAVRAATSAPQPLVGAPLAIAA